MQSKICSCCGEEKPVEEFYRNYTYKDGFQSQCKTCMRTRSLRWKKDNGYTDKKERKEELHPDISRVCNKCGAEKKLSEFYKNPRGKYGYAGICKECTKEKQLGRVAIYRRKEKARTSRVPSMGLDEWKMVYKSILPDDKVYPQGFSYSQVK